MSERSIRERNLLRWKVNHGQSPLGSQESCKSTLLQNLTKYLGVGLLAFMLKSPMHMSGVKPSGSDDARSLKNAGLKRLVAGAYTKSRFHVEASANSTVTARALPESASSVKGGELSCSRHGVTATEEDDSCVRVAA